MKKNSFDMENYKKKYNKLVESIKVLQETNPSDEGIQNWVSDNVPELKESEDKQIRKVLIDYFNRYKEQEKCGINTFFGISIDNILAWLENQGEQSLEPKWCHHTVDLSAYSEEYRKAYYDGWNNCNMQRTQCKSEMQDVMKCLIHGMKYLYEDNEDAVWGTDKWNMPVRHIINVLEKQVDMKKPDDNKPKFKVGEWM